MKLVDTEIESVNYVFIRPKVLYILGVFTYVTIELWEL